jgi:hypothetical protein
MNIFKKVVATIASVLIFSIVGAGQAQAAKTTLSGDDRSAVIAGAPSIFFDGVLYEDGDIYYSTNNVLTFGDDDYWDRGGPEEAPRWRSEYEFYPGGPSISFSALDWIVDDEENSVNGGDENGEHADEFLVITTTANSILVDFSGRQWELKDEVHAVTTIRVTITMDQNNVPSYSYIIGGQSVEDARSLCQLRNLSPTNCAPITQDLSFSTEVRAGNALRLDTQGATTEKNNVVSCTPGKYTFLNSGSTAEVSNIQSYVYTLLVNGKAVSTLSSDNFRSVASHLFPTIAGNMAGTATLEGATWDLKGMSNYSAQCQVYATQSGGNIQSVTSEVHDAVALAAAAEAAANVARDKEIISTWNTANEELAKKYRDQRLAVQP